MLYCRFCGSELPGNARFCGGCGSAISVAAEGVTDLGSSPERGMLAPDAPTFISSPSQPVVMKRQQDELDSTFRPNSSGEGWVQYSQQSVEPHTEERQAVLLDLPFVAEVAREAQAHLGNVPVVQGTPQAGGVPVVQGTPSLPHTPPGSGLSQGAASSAPSPLHTSLPPQHGSLPDNPSSGTLSGGQQEQVKITIPDMVCPASLNLSFLISGGSSVDVSWNCNAPALTANGGGTCQPDSSGNGICTDTLALASGSQGDLNWSASSDLAGVTFNPANGTLAPGQLVPVTITVPASDCASGSGHFNYAGNGGNTATVIWTCTTPTPTPTPTASTSSLITSPLQSLALAPFLLLLVSITPLCVRTSKRSRGRPRCPRGESPYKR